MATLAPPPQAPVFSHHEESQSVSISEIPLIPLLLIISILSIVVFSFLYLRTFNTLSSQGVIINDLERKRVKLILENEVWNMRISRLKSLDVIHEQPVVKSMVSVDPKEVQFISVPEKNRSKVLEPSTRP